VIEEALEELVGRKWLLAHASSSVTGYALTHDERFIREIRAALKSSG